MAPIVSPTPHRPDARSDARAPPPDPPTGAGRTWLGRRATISPARRPGKGSPRTENAPGAAAGGVLFRGGKPAVFPHVPPFPCRCAPLVSPRASRASESPFGHGGAVHSTASVPPQITRFAGRGRSGVKSACAPGRGDTRSGTRLRPACRGWRAWRSRGSRGREPPHDRAPRPGLRTARPWARTSS